MCKLLPVRTTWLQEIDANDPTIAQFMVGPSNGFLPRRDPLTVLPARFAELESLLHRMPVITSDGKPGLLAAGKFGDACNKELPLYDISDVTDMHLLSALYRDYTFVASSYLLEPCDLQYKKTKDYGLGRDRLPANIAVPLSVCAKKLSAKPFMEYALSYSLNNFKRVDPKAPLDYSNLALIRAFGGTKSEHGFILVHVAMVRHSGELVKATLDVLQGGRAHDRVRFDKGLTDLSKTMNEINTVMETMWNRSKPVEYEHFRTFIMGTKNQPMFPNGVIYEGVSTEPMSFRGESGANDSMIPTVDNLLQLTEDMPDNPLTMILKDFRSYRPTNHNEWVQWVEDEAKMVKVREFAEGDANSAVLYLVIVDAIRNFRSRHWNFTKEYILKNSSHPVATGGSPIVTWLPNQLDAILKVIQDVNKHINQLALTESNKSIMTDIVERANAQRIILGKEVAELSIRFPNQATLAVY